MSAYRFPQEPGFTPEYAEAAPTPDELAEYSGPVLLEFGAPWCAHCQAAAPAVAAAVNEVPELVHVKVYDGKGKRLGRTFGVKLWPTLVLLRHGQEQARLVRPVTVDAVRRLLASGPESLA